MGEVISIHKMRIEVWEGQQDVAEKAWTVAQYMLNQVYLEASGQMQLFETLEVAPLEAA